MDAARRRGAATGTSSTIDGAPLLPPAADGDGGSTRSSSEWEQRQIPTSWLLFQQTFWFPQFVGFTLVPNILLPVQVARLVGPDGEGSALGLVNMLIQLSGFMQPFIGACDLICVQFP